MIPNKPIHPANILLGVDGSDDCRAAIATIRDLPCFPAAHIYALSVCSDRPSPERQGMEAALAETRTLLEGGCARVSTGTREGHPAEVLVRTAAEQEADLIMLGARGRRSALDMLLGGVAQQVVEHALCPVWIARAPYAGLRRVLLAVDGSECGLKAAEYMAGFNLPGGAEIVVASVAPALGLVEFSGSAWPVGHELVPVLSDHDIEEMEIIRKQEHDRAQKLVDETTAGLVEAGRRASGVLLEGDPAGELVKFAAGKQFDLIVAGSRGLSAVRGWLMGSVSRKLVSYSACSVLIVKGTACAAG